MRQYVSRICQTVVFMATVILNAHCQQTDIKDHRSAPTPEEKIDQTEKRGKLSHGKYALQDLTNALNESGISTLPETWKKYLANETFTRINQYLKDHNGEFPLFYHAQGRLVSHCQTNETVLDLNWGTPTQDINQMITDLIPLIAFGLPLPTYGTITGMSTPEFSVEQVYLEEDLNCTEITCLQQQYKNIQCGEYNPITHNSNTSYIKALRICALKVPDELKQYEHYIAAEQAVIAISPEAACAGS